MIEMAGSASHIYRLNLQVGSSSSKTTLFLYARKFLYIHFMKKKNKNELNFLYVKINSCTLINFMEVIPSNYSKTEIINVYG